MQQLEAGTLFEGRYRIQSVLGQGGFAIVYLAKDGDLSVALKVLQLPDRDARARFQREVEVVAQLHDRHTVQLFDHGSCDDGTLYAVFEHVPGQDLSELLASRGRLEPDVVAHIARQVLQSLREAHRLGILHRDIKPANIRVFEFKGDPHSVKVLDFGIARPTQSDQPALTAAGELVGTPRYMAPEHLRERELTPAADLYSVGLVMLEMLAGSATLHGAGLGDQLERMRSGHLFSVPSAGGGGAALAAVITRCLEPRPEARFQSADEAIAALRPGKPSPAPEPPRPVRPRPSGDEIWRKIQKVIGWLCVMVLVGTVALTVLNILLRPPHPPPPSRVVGGGGAALVATPPTPGIEAAQRSRKQGRCPADPRFRGPKKFEAAAGLTSVKWTTFLPQTYDPKKPHALLLLLGANGQEAAEFLDESGFKALAEEYSFVIAAPTSPDKDAWSDLQSNEFLRDVVERVSARVCVDRARVFVAGQIAGGRGAQRLGCEDWLAGGAASAARLEELEFACPGGRAVPFLLLSSTKTTHAAVEGGVNCYGSMRISIADHERLWKERNGCTGERIPGFEFKGSKCSTWACEKAPFTSCLLDGGHNWPGAKPRKMDWGNCDGPSADFPSARVIWEFFESLQDRVPADVK